MCTRKGQSLLELTAVITLVTLGIFFAGPTIIRGINAHFKLWDDSIQDSYSDPMKKAPLEPTAINCTRDCICSEIIGNPGERCGLSNCKATQRLESKICNPATCGDACEMVPGFGPVDRCIDDPACCKDLKDTSLCGTGTGALNDCALGERVMRADCGGTKADGTPNDKYGCRQDWDEFINDGNPSCIPKCLGQYKMNPADPVGTVYTPIMCAGDNAGFPIPSPWVQNSAGIGLLLRFVGNDQDPSKCTPAQKCEVYCGLGLFVNPSGSACVNGRRFNVAPIIANATNNQSWAPPGWCTPITVTGANVSGVGCGNPGVPASPCILTVW
jgi:hypothetical protein